jgi:hypothetical protein
MFRCGLRLGRTETIANATAHLCYRIRLKVALKARIRDGDRDLVAHDAHAYAPRALECKPSGYGSTPMIDDQSYLIEAHT